MSSHENYLLLTPLEAEGIRFKIYLEASHVRMKCVSMNHLNVYFQYIKIPPPFPLKLCSSLVERSSHLCSNLTHPMISPMHLYLFTLLKPKSITELWNNYYLINRKFYPCYPNSLPTNLSSCSYTSHQISGKPEKQAACYHHPTMQIHQVFPSQNFSLNSSAHH